MSKVNKGAKLRQIRRINSTSKPLWFRLLTAYIAALASTVYVSYCAPFDGQQQLKELMTYIENIL